MRLKFSSEIEPILKFSSEIDNFKRATHQTPIFVGEFSRSGLKFQARLSEIENFKRKLENIFQAFKRDCFFFQDSGPLGRISRITSPSLHWGPQIPPTMSPDTKHTRHETTPSASSLDSPLLSWTAQRTLLLALDLHMYVSDMYWLALASCFGHAIFLLGVQADCPRP